MFLCDEVATAIRVLVLIGGPDTNARKKIVDHIAFKYYGSIYYVTQIFVDQNISMNLPISITHVLFLDNP